ncbi:hypothetical protein ACLB2K_033131 [Fragaria x ananassa]
MAARFGRFLFQNPPRPSFKFSESLRKSIQDQTNVALDITKQLLLNESLKKNLLLNNKGKDKNVVFSPLSIHAVLSMIADGAKGSNQEGMLSFLKSKSIDALNTLASNVVPLVFADGSKLGGPLLSFANGVWIDQSLSIKPAFKNFLKSESINELNTLASVVAPLVFADGSEHGGPLLSIANGVWIDQSLSINTTPDNSSHDGEKTSSVKGSTALHSEASRAALQPHSIAPPKLLLNTNNPSITNNTKHVKPETLRPEAISPNDVEVPTRRTHQPYPIAETQFCHPRPPKLSRVDARFGSKTKLLLLENEGDPLEKSKPRKEEESKLESKLGIKAKRNWNWREKKMITLKNQMQGRIVADNDVADEPRKEEDKRD